MKCATIPIKSMQQQFYYPGHILDPSAPLSSLPGRVLSRGHMSLLYSYTGAHSSLRMSQRHMLQNKPWLYYGQKYLRHVYRGQIQLLTISVTV